MGAFTAKVITLKGDPAKPESAQHIIKFPGGSIEVTRTTNNEYWAHIEVHKGALIEESVREAAQGEIVDSRLDYDYPETVIRKIPEAARLNHLAVRILTR